MKTPIGEVSALLVEKHGDKITELYNQNVLVKDIGDRVGISKTAVSRILYVLKDQGRIKDRGSKGLKNIINAAYDKIKKREGRNPYLLELQRETGIFDNVIKKNLDRPLTSGRTVGPLRGAGAKATKEMYKTKKVDRPRPQQIAGEATSVNWPSSESKKEYVKQLQEIYKNPKAKRTNQTLAKNFGISVSDVERINKVLIKELGLKYPAADNTAVSRQRYSDLKFSQGVPNISAPAVTKNQFHHIFPYAGYAKVKTGDVTVLDKYLNAKIGPENLELNRIAREIVGLDFDSDKDALNKLDELNAESEQYWNKAKGRLPKNLQGAVGYVKYNPVFDENGQVIRLSEERIGVDPKLSLQKFTDNVSKNIKDFDIEQTNKFKTFVRKVAGKGKMAVPAAIMAGIAGTAVAKEPEEPIKYNDEIGAFVNPQTDDKVSQATLLDWAANNPMPTAAVASAPLLSKTVRKGAGKLLSGLLSTLGSSTAGLGFAGLTVKENLDEGKNIVDATVDPLVGAELLFPEAAKRFGGKGLQNALGRALSLGRVGAMMTPVGIGITGLGIGKELYNVAQEEQDRINAMTPEEKLEYFAEQQELMDVSA